MALTVKHAFVSLVADAGDPNEVGPNEWNADHVITGTIAGSVVQVVNFQTGASSTTTVTIPIDDTIPQITEGAEFMTLAITPTSATNKLRIEVIVNIGVTTTLQGTVALFQDATANALAACSSLNATGNGCAVGFSHYMTAGTTSSTTFRVRAGLGGSGTLTFNGTGGNRNYGGVCASSITITEIAA